MRWAPGRAAYVLLAAALWCASLTPRAAPDLAADRAALLAFRDAVGQRLPWDAAAASPCGWRGVRCDPAASRVTALQLPGASLVGAVPLGTIGNLTALRTLSLRLNALSGGIPADIGSCTELRHLYLQGNQLDGQVPEGFFDLGLLQRLDLSNNRIAGGVSPGFNRLQRLATLYLENNSLNGTLPSNLDLPKLQLFNVSRNNLTGPVPKSLARMPASAFDGTGLCEDNGRKIRGDGSRRRPGRVSRVGHRGEHGHEERDEAVLAGHGRQQRQEAGVLGSGAGRAVRSGVPSARVGRGDREGLAGHDVPRHAGGRRHHRGREAAQGGAHPGAGVPGQGDRAGRAPAREPGAGPRVLLQPGGEADRVRLRGRRQPLLPPPRREPRAAGLRGAGAHRAGGRARRRVHPRRRPPLVPRQHQVVQRPRRRRARRRLRDRPRHPPARRRARAPEARHRVPRPRGHRPAQGVAGDGHVQLRRAAPRGADGEAAGELGPREHRRRGAAAVGAHGGAGGVDGRGVRRQHRGRGARGGGDGAAAAARRGMHRRPAGPAASDGRGGGEDRGHRPERGAEGEGRHGG
uniref:Leucine-rich repeat-containing N-terminal plant-type domain-containing protein n=1 Tax=Zea mays TaxID=4577 RepID=A0A804Q8C7_MAIZE